MFETISSPGKRRSFRATAGSAEAHGAAIAVAVLLAGIRTPPPPPRDFRIVPPRPFVSQPGGRATTSQPARPTDRSANKPKPPRLALSREAAVAREPPEPSAAPEPATGDESGPRAAETTSIGDTGGGGGSGPFTPGVGESTPEYEAGRMTPPRQISGPDPEYTTQALQNEVQGLMVVKCIVTLEGAVHACRVLQGLPFMDSAVVAALERRRYLPARLPDGRAVEVDYTFRIRLQLPR
jgi:protein TonB